MLSLFGHLLMWINRSDLTSFPDQAPDGILHPPRSSAGPAIAGGVPFHLIEFDCCHLFSFGPGLLMQPCLSGRASRRQMHRIAHHDARHLISSMARLGSQGSRHEGLSSRPMVAARPALRSPANLPQRWNGPSLSSLQPWSTSVLPGRRQHDALAWPALPFASRRYRPRRF